MTNFKLKNVIYIALINIISLLFLSCTKKEKETTKPESTPEQFIAEIKFPSPDTIVGKVGDYTIDFKTAEEKMSFSLSTNEKFLTPEQFKLFKKQIINEYLKVWSELKLFSITAEKEAIKTDQKDIDEVMTYFKIQTPPSITTEEYLKILSFDKGDIEAIAKAHIYLLKHIPLDLSDESLKKFYKENKNNIIIPERVNLFAIVIDILPQDTDQQKKAKKEKAEESLKNLNSGEDFSKISKEYSTDTALVLTGGDMGYMDSAALSEPFLSTFKKLKVGEYSNVIETQNGYWIIKINKIISAYGDNFEKDKDYIKIIAKILHYNKNKQKLITEISKEIPSEINPDGIKNVQIKKGDEKTLPTIQESPTQQTTSNN